MVVYGLTLFELLKVITPSIVAVGNTTLITIPACPMPASLKITTSPGAGMPRCPGGAEPSGISCQPGCPPYTTHRSKPLPLSPTEQPSDSPPPHTLTHCQVP